MAIKKLLVNGKKNSNLGANLGILNVEFIQSVIL